MFLSLAKKNLDPDTKQHENWDTDPHQNVLDPPHCIEGLQSTSKEVDDEISSKVEQI